MPTKDHDLHLWMEADLYAWIARKAREQDRSKNAFVTRILRQARAEELEDDEAITRDDLGHVRPKSGSCRGCAS